jgi:hypothetical protein
LAAGLLPRSRAAQQACRPTPPRCAPACAATGVDLQQLSIIKGKACWTVFVDALVLNDDGNVLDALSYAARWAGGLPPARPAVRLAAPLGQGRLRSPEHLRARPPPLHARPQLLSHPSTRPPGCR